MKINGINIVGIKKAVGDIRAEYADRWILLLDMCDWRVRERGLIGGDVWNCQSYEIIIASGNANNGWGRDYIKMREVCHIIEEVMATREKARSEYAQGIRHSGAYPDGDETCAKYVHTEIKQAIDWLREKRICQ